VPTPSLLTDLRIALLVAEPQQIAAAIAESWKSSRRTGGRLVGLDEAFHRGIGCDPRAKA